MVENDFVSVMPDKAMTSRAAFMAFVKNEVAQWQTHLQGKLGPHEALARASSIHCKAEPCP